MKTETMYRCGYMKKKLPNYRSDNKHIFIKGFCRNCWHRFDVAFPSGDATGKTLVSLREWIGYLIRCCAHPDPRW